MRVVEEIPHELFKITIYSWNAKFIIKIELDNYEQTFKINESDISGIQDIKTIINEEFLNEIFHNFLAMKTSFGKAYKHIY